METIISVKEVTKSFKETTALDHISAEFEKGKIHGIVGRNGSGKTVLFKCICGLMYPDSGEVWSMENASEGCGHARKCRRDH